MIEAILFDFDGVILDSMLVRDGGFRKIFEGFPKEKVEELIRYHQYNAGLSRYVKIRYFYEHLLGRAITEAEVNRYAEEFSRIMRAELVKTTYLIRETVDFIAAQDGCAKHVVSGSDEKELNLLCRELGIDRYFVTMRGSPVPKIDLVADILAKFGYDRGRCVLIGDSVNDYEAAVNNGIRFVGYNNPDLKTLGLYVDSFRHVSLETLAGGAK